MVHRGRRSYVVYWLYYPDSNTTLLGSDNSLITIVGDWAKVKDQLGAFKDITFVDLDGKPIPAPQ